MSAPTSPSESIPILVMNICISFSIFIAERLTSKIGKYIAAPPVSIGNKTIRKTPVNPANNPPSLKPPVSQINSIAVMSPASAAGRTKASKKRGTGISRRRRAICQVAIRSIKSSPFQRSVTLTQVSTAARNASQPPL